MIVPVTVIPSEVVAAPSFLLLELGPEASGAGRRRLVPFEAPGNVAHADDRPRAFHRSSAVG